MIQLFLPSIAEAAPPAIPPSVLNFVGKISTEILNPIIALMFGLATAYFIYGIAGYIWNPDNEEAKEKGRRTMVWGIIGMFVMVSVFAILRLLINTIGADANLINYV